MELAQSLEEAKDLYDLIFNGLSLTETETYYSRILKGECFISHGFYSLFLFFSFSFLFFSLLLCLVWCPSLIISTVFFTLSFHRCLLQWLWGSHPCVSVLVWMSEWKSVCVSAFVLVFLCLCACLFTLCLSALASPKYLTMVISIS